MDPGEGKTTAEGTIPSVAKEAAFAGGSFTPPSETLQLALFLLSGAVQADEKKEFEKAVRLYYLGITNLNIASAEEIVADRKAVIQSKTKEYTDRLQYLETYLGLSSPEVCATHRTKVAMKSSKVVRYADENVDVHEYFLQVDENDVVVQSYACAVDSIVNQGRLCLTRKRACFLSKEKKILRSFAYSEIIGLEKKSVMLVPNITVTRAQDTMVFTAFVSQTEAYDVLQYFWNLHRPSSDASQRGPAASEQRERAVNPRLCTSIMPELAAIKYPKDVALFKQCFLLPSYIQLIEHYSCVLGDSGGQGRIYITKNMLYYHSAAGFSSAETSLKIPIRTIKKIEKQESWGGVDTHLLIETDNGEDFTFRRFVNRRDECYSILIHLWSILRDTQPVFGAHLPDVLKAEKRENGIPLVVDDTATCLRQGNGLDTPGLFRISADTNAVGVLADLYNENVKVVLSVDEPHMCANLFKKFFRDLRDPLLTFELYTCFIAQFDSKNKLDEDSYVEQFQALVRQLPKENQIVLKFLLDFLAEVAEHSSENKMDTVNLSRVFGPLLLRYEGEIDTLLLKETQSAIGIVAFMITHRNDIF